MEMTGNVCELVDSLNDYIDKDWCVVDLSNLAPSRRILKRISPVKTFCQTLERKHLWSQYGRFLPIDSDTIVFERPGIRS